MEVTIIDWGKSSKGEPVCLYRLTNKHGNYIELTDYGATWVSAYVPDKDGNRESVILGFPTLQGYLEDTCYIGASVGRYANRIEKASFNVGGVQYKVSANTGEHSLHGGKEGFSHRVWDAKVDKDSITFSLISPDGDQGFPGELKVSVTYSWDDNNQIDIRFKAITDKATPLNLTNHAYFNLFGDKLILNHHLKINAQHYLPMKEGCIVTGEKRPVEGSVFDFRKFKTIGQDIDKSDEQLILCKGYDESFVIKDVDDGKMMDVAEAFDPVSGRSMKMSSTFPTVHLYAANFLSSTQAGFKGKLYGERYAFCLEAQFAPNSPNLKNFPSCILEPGEIFDHTISVKFSLI